MIIEMSSLMSFQTACLDNVYLKPRSAYDHARIAIGYVGGSGIEVYLHHWDEFVEKVHEADKVMQESKLFYEKRIKEWEDREIARARKEYEKDSDDDSDEDSAA